MAAQPGYREARDAARAGTGEGVPLDDFIRERRERRENR
jgi:hypothetical protein